MWLGEVAHHMALVPWVVLAWKRPTNHAWYWLAGVFLVAWLADWGAHGLNPWLVGAVYPLSQAGLVASVTVPRFGAAVVVMVLTIVALLLAPVWGHGPDILFRTVAWGTILLLLWGTGVGGRGALLTYFGLGLLAWFGYAFWPGWTSWGLYQGIRALGIGWFSNDIPAGIT